MNLLLGVLSGASSAALTTPTDVLKVRMQVYIVGSDLVSVLSFVGYKSKLTGQPFIFLLYRLRLVAQTTRWDYLLASRIFIEMRVSRDFGGVWVRQLSEPL